MSLGIVVKGSEGVVLAADSRVSLQAQAPGNPLQFLVTFDNATKLLTFADPHNYIGAVTYGDAVIGTTPTDLRTAQSFIPEFEVGLPQERISVQDFAQRLSDFFMQQWQAKMPANHPGSGMVFVIGGFDIDAAYGSVYLVNIPNQPVPQERSANAFGMTMGGQNEYVTRLVQGYDPSVLNLARQAGNLSNNQIRDLKERLAGLNIGIPYAILPLQDCIDLAIFLIRTTVTAQNLSIAVRGVGGAIDVAVITRREGLRIIQQKELVGEKSSYQ